MADEQKKRPTSLIQNKKIEPAITADTVQTNRHSSINVEKTPSEKKISKKNQEANIKTSLQTKNEIDILMKLTDNKFAYEMIESLIDHYVETALDSDKKRAFKTLRSL